MNEELKQKLMQAGVSEAAITILVEQELTTDSDLQGFTYERFVQMGIKAGSAKKLTDLFGPKESALQPAAPTSPQTIVVKTGKPEDMSLRELVNAIADGERSTDYVVALHKHVGNKRVFVRKLGQEGMDVEATLELIDHVGTDPEGPEFWGEQPTETLEEILERRAMANPITGAKLAKGDPWMGVNEERRILAAYARLANLFTGKEDEYMLVSELKAEKMGDRWTRIQASFKRAEKAHDPLVDQARAALYFRKGVRSILDEPFRQRPTF